MDIWYAGIGSRETPKHILEIIEKLTYVLAKKGFKLRTGGADGCDTAAEKGCDRGNGQKEVYLPWKGFNGNQSELFDVCDKAIELAFKYHPNLYGQKDSVIKLIARNGYQVLGKNLKTKVHFVLCYCPVVNSVPQGGTSQAIRIAEDKSIPVFNLFFPEDLERLKEFIKEVEEKLSII